MRALVRMSRGRTHRSKTRFFWASVMGLTRAWLPSRRSDEAHRGALVMRLSGHVRSGRLTEAKGLQGGYKSQCVHEERRGVAAR